jgi:hypothetical protein
VTSLLSGSDRRVSIRPWQARTLQELAAGEGYDTLLASVGYEPRSVAVGGALRELAHEKVAVQFSEQQTDSYRRSLENLSAAGFQINDEWDARFPGFVMSWLDGLSQRGGDLRIAIDVSSMNRKRIAAVVEALAAVKPIGSLSVDLLYAPAVLQVPPGLPDGVLSIAPVSPFFAGELHPGASTVALVGVGYEPHKAAGALNSLEIPCSAVYVPDAPDASFMTAVLSANSGLLEGADKHERVRYDLLDPFDCLVRLDGRCHALLRAGEVPAILPLGPKVFALCACLVAAIHHPQVQVWRASFDADELALEREADGSVCGVNVLIEAARRDRG